MKKIIVLMILAASLVFGGCGSSEKVISGDVNNGTADSGVVAETDATVQEDTTTDSSKEEGYVFVSNGVSVVIDADAAEYIAALGEPVSYYEAPSCAFGDLDKIYTYSGFELDTYSLEGVDYVSAVILKDDSIATPEGLYIGDDSAKVSEIYGEATMSDDSSMTYVKDHMKLCILIKDGVVANIQYLSRVLE